jgi:hypothetical protein
MERDVIINRNSCVTSPAKEDDGRTGFLLQKSRLRRCCGWRPLALFTQLDKPPSSGGKQRIRLRREIRRLGRRCWWEAAFQRCFPFLLGFLETVPKAPAPGQASLVGNGFVAFPGRDDPACSNVHNRRGCPTSFVLDFRGYYTCASMRAIRVLGFGNELWNIRKCLLVSFAVAVMRLCVVTWEIRSYC